MFTNEKDLEIEVYIDEMLAEWDEPPSLPAVVQNILDEPILKAVKKRLLKTLLSSTAHPVLPVCKLKFEKRKAVLEEFYLIQPKRKLWASKYRELLSLIATKHLK